MNKPRIVSVSLLLMTALIFSGCETPGEGAKHGAIIGAGVGALKEGSLRGAARGAAIGAATGALLGKIAKDRREERYNRDDEVIVEERYYRERPRYPVARPTNRYGFVTSPYAPYHLIDVRGIPSGARVVDPSNDLVFINP
jgi:hypothetical protein